MKIIYCAGLLVISLLVTPLYCRAYTVEKQHMNGSYFGNHLINPGLSYSFNYALLRHERKKTKQLENGYEVLWNRWWVINSEAFLCSFWHPGSYSLLSNTYGFNVQRLSRRRFIYQFGTNAGFTRTFLPETYKITYDNRVQQVFLPGYLFPTTHIFFGTGRYLAKQEQIKGWTAQFHLLNLHNYNTFTLPLINLSTGIIF